MTGLAVDPIGCAVFVLTAFSLAGCAQAAWLAWPPSRQWAIPLDCGLTVRGRRLFGPNKTVRGMLIMIPATSAAFVLLAAVSGSSGPWELPLTAYSALGALAGLGFMAAELPNSFVKRQLAIPSGQPAHGRVARQVFFFADQLDSPCGGIATMALAVPMPAVSVVILLTFGAVVHLLFSALTYRLGGKARAL